MDYLYALADFYLKRNRLAEAQKVAEKMVAAHPDQRIGREIMELIERRNKGQ
jgi:predicted Zn-dependent protease